MTRGDIGEGLGRIKGIKITIQYVERPCAGKEKGRKEILFRHAEKRDRRRMEES